MVKLHQPTRRRTTLKCRSESTEFHADVGVGWSTFTLRQGLTLVHYSAQLEPFLTQKHTLHTPNTTYHPLNNPETIPYCTPMA
jgi:hypothetical protein